MYRYVDTHPAHTLFKYTTNSVKVSPYVVFIVLFLSMTN